MKLKTIYLSNGELEYHINHLDEGGNLYLRPKNNVAEHVMLGKIKASDSAF